MIIDNFSVLQHHSLGEREAGHTVNNAWVSEWVSEQFLNGTSAQCRLFSAVPLKAEKRYDIQSKCIKENKWATIQENKKSLYGTIQMNISNSASG